MKARTPKQDAPHRRPFPITKLGDLWTGILPISEQPIGTWYLASTPLFFRLKEAFEAIDQLGDISVEPSLETVADTETVPPNPDQ